MKASKKFSRMVLATVCVLSFCSPGYAQEPLRIEHNIDSNFPDQERAFSVQLPPSYYAQSQYDYPVLYLLDGESNLEFTAAVADFLAESGSAPEMIIVAIRAGTSRARDYLPGNPAGGPSGDADQFLDFLEREPLPFVEANYRAAPLRLISGHSLGGVLVTHALIERGELFRGYITQSPYVVQPIGGPLVERFEKVLATGRKLDAFFYMNVGDEPDLASNIERMKTALEASTRDGFEWYAEHEAGKTHMSTRLVGQYAALERFLGDDWSVEPGQMTPDLAQQVAALSAKYGYPVLLPESAFQQATQRALSQQNIPFASESARLYAVQYPSSPLAHLLLARSLASGGERAGATEAIETAIALFEADPKPDLQPVFEQMKLIRERLEGGGG